MEFGETIRHPVLQAAVQVGEATIRDACAAVPELEIQVELAPFPDGREAVCVTVKARESRGHFTMLLRNYFDRGALWRVAREAWRRREPCGHETKGWGGCGLN